ncbi:MAG: hypothetical protein JHC98_01915 [Thermoleophilaceae bacterium]|nr:hypothetical protein [Thermoleophilaceae bacterium]
MSFDLARRSSFVLAAAICTIALLGGAQQTQPAGAKTRSVQCAPKDSTKIFYSGSLQMYADAKNRSHACTRKFGRDIALQTCEFPTECILIHSDPIWNGRFLHYFYSYVGGAQASISQPYVADLKSGRTTMDEPIQPLDQSGCPEKPCTRSYVKMAAGRGSSYAVSYTLVWVGESTRSMPERYAVETRCVGADMKTDGYKIVARLASYDEARTLKVTGRTAKWKRAGKWRAAPLC